MDSAKGSALLLVALAVAMNFFLGWNNCMVMAKPRRILLDTDVDTDDFFALLYILKQNRSEFDLKVTTFFFLSSIKKLWFSTSSYALIKLYFQCLCLIQMSEECPSQFGIKIYFFLSLLFL